MKKNAKGAPGYNGYEYQIETSIWIALELMLKSKSSVVIHIEPESSEDIEVLLLQCNATQSSDQAIDKLIIQCKGKSKGLWTVSDFKEIIGNGRISRVSSRGPTPRVRALQSLLEQPGTAYCFITNAWVEGKLQTLTHDELDGGMSSTEVPVEFLDSELKYKSPSLNGRIRILQGLSRELIGYRTEKLLERFAKVPHLKIDACISALKSNLRDRLLGAMPPPFTLDDLNKIISAQGGMSKVKSSRVYYPPTASDQILHQLMNANALLITGPPGVGKTLFAEYLAELLQQQTPPFAVTHERDSISNIRNILSESGPALFVISDPWGTTVHETPTSLSHELVNLLIHASADKKFIITTRSDLYERALEATKLFLSEYVVEIVPESYSEHSRWSIATQGLADIVGGIEVAERNRLEISRDLTTPYELSAFNLILKKEIQKYDICVNNEFAWLDHYEAKWLLDGEELDERVKIETIIAKAASKTTIYMTLLMLKGWSLHGIEHTAICWTLLSALGTVKKSVFIEEFLRVSEESSSDLTPKDFVEFLCNSHIVSSENDFIYVHSYQSEGMAKLIQENSKAAMQGLKIASDYLLGAIRDRGFSSVAGNYIRVISTWLGFFRTVAPFKGIVTSVDRLLESQCRLSRDQGFYEAATLSMWWGYGQSNFIKILSFFNISWPEHGSKARLNYSEDDLKLVLMDRNTVHYLIPRIIKEYLPFTNTSYQHHTQEFVDLVFRFDINLGDECRAALDIIYDRMYVDYGDGVCDEPDLDVNIKPLKSLLALYSSDPYIDKFTSQDTDLYNPYK